MPPPLDPREVQALASYWGRVTQTPTGYIIPRRVPIPIDVFMPMIEMESQYHPEAVGPTTKTGERARGLTQMMPEAWSSWLKAHKFDSKKFDVFNPSNAIQAGMDHLEGMIHEFDGDMRKAVAAYNWGPTRVKAAVNRLGDRWELGLPKSTMAYLNKVFGITPAGATVAGEKMGGAMARRIPDEYPGLKPKEETKIAQAPKKEEDAGSMTLKSDYKYQPKGPTSPPPEEKPPVEAKTPRPPTPLPVGPRVWEGAPGRVWEPQRPTLLPTRPFAPTSSVTPTPPPSSPLVRAEVEPFPEESVRSPTPAGPPRPRPEAERAPEPALPRLARETTSRVTPYEGEIPRETLPAGGPRFEQPPSMRDLISPTPQYPSGPDYGPSGHLDLPPGLVAPRPPRPTTDADAAFAARYEGRSAPPSATSPSQQAIPPRDPWRDILARRIQAMPQESDQERALRELLNLLSPRPTVDERPEPPPPPEQPIWKRIPVGTAP